MNREEFNIVVYKLRDKVFRFARRIMSDTTEAEDLTQDFFLKFWLIRDNLDGARNIEALAMTTVKNLCLDRIKKKKPILADIESDFESAMKTNTEKDYENNDITCKIYIIINNLPDIQRMIFHLRDIEGYEYSEIETILGIDRNCLKVNLSRARKKIRELLVKRYNYEYR